MSRARACRRAFPGLSLALAAAAAAPSAQASDGPKPGDVFAAQDGTRVSGWLYSGGSLWGDALEHCCVAYFQRGNALMLALTERVGPERDGRERIRLVHRLPVLRRSLETADCVMDGRMMLLAVHDLGTGRVTGYHTDGRRFIETVRPFADVERQCDFPQAQ